MAHAAARRSRAAATEAEEPLPSGKVVAAE